MLRIKKGDTVSVIKGKDKSKKGRIIELFPERKRALVEGINMVKKHKKQTRQDQQGGIVSIETPISMSNILLFCKQCDRGVRVGFSVLKDGSKIRSCKVCKGAI
ncbi:MAG TPA: 50S ribosomal protein L24 [Candidatus Margulisiibacteriota bacterium]|nr:50S ribosomal protein L24 [Candidatus Margulisiibacteriota bacterium]